MMGGGRLILLKTGRPRPESAKQAEIGLADFLKILRIAESEVKTCSRKAKGTCDGCAAADFREVWLIGRRLCRMLSRSHL
jgi:hypothetical protein